MSNFTYAIERIRRRQRFRYWAVGLPLLIIALALPVLRPLRFCEGIGYATDELPAAGDHSAGGGKGDVAPHAVPRSPRDISATAATRADMRQPQRPLFRHLPNGRQPQVLVRRNIRFPSQTAAAATPATPTR